MAKNSDGNNHKDAKPQDSTSRLPMIELETAIKVVADIRDKAIETAAMTDVAKALGYASATSSPFYRRITAARLFNLLSSKSALTQEAIDYIKPHDEQMKAKVLAKAIGGIPPYVELISRYAGKKLNVELVTNSIAKDYSLTDACALICAKAFEASLRFAGMLSSDGSVLPHQVNGGLPSAPEPKEPSGSLPMPGDASKPPKEAEVSHDTQQHTLFLDKDKSRSFVFTGPLEITRSEYGRICKWLEFTMLIVEEKNEVAT